MTDIGERTTFLLSLDDKDFNNLYNSVYNMQLSKGKNIGFKKTDRPGKPGKIEKLIEFATEAQIDRLKEKLRQREERGGVDPLGGRGKYDRSTAAPRKKKNKIEEAKIGKEPIMAEPETNPLNDNHVGNGQLLKVNEPVQPIKLLSSTEIGLRTGIEVSTEIHTKFIIKIPPVEVILKGEYAQTQKLVNKIAEDLAWVVEQTVKDHAEKIY